jgi:hypothetical protein
MSNEEATMRHNSLKRACPTGMILTFTLMVAGCSQDSEKVTKLQVEKEKLAAQIADLQKEQAEGTRGTEESS